MRGRWQVDRTWDDLAELPWPFALIFGSYYTLTVVRDAVLFVLVVAIAIACLIFGTTLARYAGVVLIGGCVVAAFTFLRKHTTRR
jgi:CHASE2 domain-containing sensor protein